MTRFPRTLLITASLAAATGAAWAQDLSERFETDTPRLEETAIGNWRGYAFADPATGAFDDCVIGSGNAEGTAYLNFWRGAEGALRVQVLQPDADREAGDAVEASLWFDDDRSDERALTGEVVSPRTVRLAGAAADERRFARSFSAHVSIGDDTLAFALSASNQALRWLDECVDNNADRRARPVTATADDGPADEAIDGAPIDMAGADETDAGDAGDAGDGSVVVAAPAAEALDEMVEAAAADASSTQPFAIGEPRPPLGDGAVAVILANGLSDLGIGSRLGIGADGAITWSSEAAAGSLRALGTDEQSDPATLRATLVAQIIAQCRGGFSAETIDGDARQAIVTSCGDTRRVHTILVGADGVLLSSVDGADADGIATRLADTIAPELAR